MSLKYLFISFYTFGVFAGTTEKLQECRQEQLLSYWNVLSPDEQKDLSSQVEQLDLNEYYKQRESVLHPNLNLSGEISTFQDYHSSGSPLDTLVGKQIIAEGRVGCLIVAGGQGTRLKCNGPKGVFPVTLIKQKSLFQLVAEKIRAAGIQCQQPLLMAVMTSPGNHQETLAHFEQNNYFGLQQNQVYFFSQGDLPFLDQEGNLFLETPSKIAAGPDGNAASLKCFVDKGVWSAWHQQGIDYLVYLHIDNPLADPFDAELVGFHHSQKGTDMVIKCIARQDPLEKLGVILQVDGKVQVIEYSEIFPEERDSRTEDGRLRHICGNVSLFCFKMDFIKDIADRYYGAFPFHKAWKAAKYLSPSGETQMSPSPIAWKFEKFIFDALPFARAVKTVMYPREFCFAPLKNASGADSIADVQEALQKYDRQIITEITGMTPPQSIKFELDPQFYYPTDAILTKWKGKTLTESSYIDP